MKILVTGGEGFIGRYVVEEVEKQGHTAVVFDHYDRGHHKAPKILGDVRDATTVTEAMAHVDAFIHLAAVLGTQETIKNPRPAAESNLIGGLNILEAADQYNVPGTYIGVGNHWMNNTYSITKTAVERFVHMFNKERGTKVNIVRAMNAYGPRQRPALPYGTSRVRKIAPAFICRALCNHPVEVYGDGGQISDMIYVTDVANVLVKATLDAANGIVYEMPIEVGPIHHNTVQEIASLVIKLCNSKSEIVNLPMRPGEIPGDTVTANYITLDLAGIDPKTFVPLEEGLTNTIEYFRKYLIENNIS